MHVVILCGGKGTRLEGLDLPKPLCTLRGRPLIYHVIESLPQDIRKLTFFYHFNLDRVQFQRAITHSCAFDKDIDFVCLTADTRGPVETAYSCLHKTGFSLDEPILFLDNDSVNRFSVTDIDMAYPSIGTFHTQNTKAPYSFVKVENGNVTSIREKVGISNTYCTGIYYFPNVRMFFTLRNILVTQFPDKSEYFMSDIYNIAIQNKYCVRSFSCIDNIPLGTITDIQENIGRIKSHSMRICFDIDNTILTSSIRKGSHQGIEPIPYMVQMIRSLYNQGHIIILHTARSMETCNSNVGAATKRGALNVLTKLEEYNVPYHEIYFGKPWAHLYVDDKCWNQYTNPGFPEWMFGYKAPMPIERGCSNNQNVLYKKGNVLVKEGPISSLEAEIYFYKNVPVTLHYFPEYYRSTPTVLEIEFIEGQTMGSIFRNCLLTNSLLHTTVESLHELHSSTTISPEPSPTDVFDNYVGTLYRHRSNRPEVYDLPFIDVKIERIRCILQHYVKTDKLSIRDLVHGDFWFDNILVTPQHQIKMIDMRGKVGTLFTLKGDPMLDYAKLYQSILGFDFVIRGEKYPLEYEKNCRAWLAECLPVRLDDPVLEAITACCILKSFFYFSDISRIRSVYNILDKLVIFQEMFELSK